MWSQWAPITTVFQFASWNVLVWLYECGNTIYIRQREIWRAWCMSLCDQGAECLSTIALRELPQKCMSYIVYIHVPRMFCIVIEPAWCVSVCRINHVESLTSCCLDLGCLRTWWSHRKNIKGTVKEWDIVHWWPQKPGEDNPSTLHSFLRNTQGVRCAVTPWADRFGHR